jgi:hypothetical protein
LKRPAAALVLAIALAAGCANPTAILISVGADAPAQQIDLYVQDEATEQIIFHSGFSPVAAGGQPRDLTRTKLKLALKLSRAGKFKLLLVGVAGDLVDGKPSPTATQLFWAAHVHVDGTTELQAQLLTVPPGDDSDGDLWPDATDFPAHVPLAAVLYQHHPELLDCDDKIDSPNGLPLRAADINPFAVETCGDGYDQNCNGNGDEQCHDVDGDGDPSATDCDDKDPKRHHPTAADPFPDPPNCCGYSLGKQGTPDANKDFTGDPVLCPMKRCGDGIDESCSGHDTVCVVDDDCDGYPAQPQGNDCNDHDPNVHPGAPEICGNGVDDNCNGLIDDGCIPCDLDGDGFERSDPSNGCPDANDKHPGQVDCNDYDSGVFPGQMDKFGGKEAGESSGKIASSLRGNCRRIYEPTGTGGTAKLASFSEKVGDADCNGTPYEGCPDPSCDKDGDGWPAFQDCDPTKAVVDCDDTDPTVFPGAPDRCGDGKAQNCSGDTPCDNDVDKDGYNAGVDCDDGNPNIHPWAAEVCNGVDDDCDQLVDEGNPDGAGAPMVSNGALTACTDDDDGECGKHPGVCVCTAAQLAATSDPMHRTFCPTEQAGGPKPPRCVGAGQPLPQSCDATNPKDDDCDGRVDAPDGKNLVAKGQPCGLSRGQCKSGVVVGCDRSQVSCFRTPPFDALNLVPASQAWYVCSPETVCPSAEVCNGLDDDCDGQLPGTALAPFPANDERDHDGDKYIACSGCDPTKLAPGLLGCGDCDDVLASVHPTAPELCNGIDDDCDPSTADGATQCGASGTCCAQTLTCRNLATDVANCGKCGNDCNAGHPDAANGCGAGGCTCNGGAACGAQMYCTGTGCALCNTATHCGPSCAACGPGEPCKADGSGCGACSSNTDCKDPTRPYCNNGSCKSTKPDGAMCTFDTDCTNNHCAGGYCCATACPATGCSADVQQQTKFTCMTGTCTQNGMQDCGNYRCYNGACNTSCQTDAYCDGTHYCNNFQCTDHKPNGETCSADGDCTNGHCVNKSTGGKVCCDTSCGPATSCYDDFNRTVNNCDTGTCTATSVACPSGQYCNGNTCQNCDVDGFCGPTCGTCETVFISGISTFCNKDYLCEQRIAKGGNCSASECPSTNQHCLQCRGPQQCNTSSGKCPM